MSQNLTFVHLTDLHIGDPEMRDKSLHSDTVATLRAILADVKQVSPAPAFVVVSGDVTNRGTVASYRLAKAIIDEGRSAYRSSSPSATTIRGPASIAPSSVATTTISRPTTTTR